MSFNESGEAIILGFRLTAFIIGVALLLSGFADFTWMESSDILVWLSSSPMIILKIVVGLILTLTAINPEIIRVVIQWIIRS